MAVERPDYSSPADATEKVSGPPHPPGPPQAENTVQFPAALPATTNLPPRGFLPGTVDEIPTAKAFWRSDDSGGDRTPRLSGGDGPTPPPVSVPGYDIEAVLGRGGMGVVYKARQVALNRTVALKMILSGGHASTHELRRFCNEAEAIARLKHPNIVQIYEIGEHEGLPYFSLEYCSGGSLAEHLDGTPLLPRQAVALVETLARAIHAAHRAGIVHRDLKPANILLANAGWEGAANREGEAPAESKDKGSAGASPSLPPLVHCTLKITDFGLAKKLDEAGGPTVSGAIMGTPSYMAPEQAAGRTQEISPRSDVYALGAILYEMLTGRPPFRGATLLATLEQVRDVEPVAPGQLQPRLPRDLETICLKCLQKESDRRYPSAEELADDLRRFGAGEPIKARATPAWEQVWKWAKRRPALAALIAAVVVITSVGFSLVSWQWLRAESARAEAARRAEAEAVAKRNESEARQFADSKRQEAQRTSTSLLLEKGVALCEQRQYGAGLLWLTRALELADPAAEDQVQSVRLLLGSWSTHLSTVQGIYPHSYAISALAVSPNGGTLLTGSRDKTVRLWDVATGKQLGEPLRYGPIIRDIAIRPDGEIFAIAGSDGKISLYEHGTRKLLRGFLAHPGGVNSVTFSSDGKSILTAGMDMTVRLWDDQGRPASPPLSHPAVVTSGVLSRDGKGVLTGCRDGKARLWDPRAGTISASWDHGAVVLGAVLSPDGKTALTGSQDGRVRLWSVDVPGRPADELPRHAAAIMGVAFRPDGRAILTVTQGGLVQLWDLTTRELLAEPLRHHGEITAAVFGSDGQSVWTASRDMKVRQWGPPRRASILAGLGELRQEGVLGIFVFSPDGRIIAGASGDETVRRWDARTCKLLEPVLRHKEKVRGLVFSPDGRVLLTHTAGATSHLWESATGRPVGGMPRHDKIMNTAVFSPNGQTILTASDDGTARLWGTADGAPLGVPMVHKDRVAFAFFAPDGQIVLTGCVDHTARLWDAADGKPLGDALPHGGVLDTAVFRGDGRLFLTIDTTGARVWDTASAQTGAREPARTGAMPLWHDLRGIVGVFSPDGNSVLTAGNDQTARLWEATTGQSIGEPMPHQGVLRGAAFRQDGRIAMTRGGNLVRLWDAATGKPVGQPLRHGNRVAAFSPDGSTLLTVGDDHKGQLWDGNTGKPLGGALSHGGPLSVGGFRPDGLAFLLKGDDGVGRLYPVPTPLSAPPEQIKLWVEVCSGLALDAAGAVLPLDSPTWQRRYDRLRALGELGPR